MAKKLKILFDADAFIALIKEDDSNHKKAVSILKKIKNCVVFITQFTIPETVAVISKKISQNKAKEFLAAIREKNLTEVSLTELLVDKTDQIFLDQKKNGTSWIDCLNVAAVENLDLDGIFSFDKFYKKMEITSLA